MVKIEFDGVIFREGNAYVSYSPKLDVSSCGDTVEEARRNLLTAVRLFLEEAERMGTLEEILAESGYIKTEAGRWETPVWLPGNSWQSRRLHGVNSDATQDA